jgi:hypothetical protein
MPVYLLGAMLVDFDRTAKRVGDIALIPCEHEDFVGIFGPLRAQDATVPKSHNEHQIGLFNHVLLDRGALVALEIQPIVSDRLSGSTRGRIAPHGADTRRGHGDGDRIGGTTESIEDFLLHQRGSHWGSASVPGANQQNEQLGKGLELLGDQYPRHDDPTDGPIDPYNRRRSDSIDRSGIDGHKLDLCGFGQLLDFRDDSLFALGLFAHWQSTDQWSGKESGDVSEYFIARLPKPNLVILGLEPTTGRFAQAIDGARRRAVAVLDNQRPRPNLASQPQGSRAEARDKIRRFLGRAWD